MKGAFWSFQVMVEAWTCSITTQNCRELKLGSFGTGLSRFGLITKKLWPKRTEKDLRQRGFRVKFAPEVKKSAHNVATFKNNAYL